MTQLKPSTAVGRMFTRCAWSAFAGATVSYAANHYAVVPMLQSLAQVVLHHEEFASPGVGQRLLAVLAVAALLFGVSIASDKRRNALLDAAASGGRRVAGWLMTGAAAKVCFLCGALAGFGGRGWLAGLLTFLMYAVILACVRTLLVYAQMPPRAGPNKPSGCRLSGRLSFFPTAGSQPVGGCSASTYRSFKWVQLC